MSSKKYTKSTGKSGGDNELIGVVLVIVSVFLLLCIVIPPILGVISLALHKVVVGVLGASAYPIFLCTLILGIALIQNRKAVLKAKVIACIVVIALFTVLILQLATSHTLLSQDFSQYVAGVYGNLTAGGVLFGVIAFGLAKAVTPILAYIICSLVVVAMLALLIAPRFMQNKERAIQASKNTKSRKVVPINTSRNDFVKGVAPAQTVKPVADSTLFVDKIIPNSNRITTQIGQFSTLQSAPSTQSVPKNNIAQQKKGQSIEFESYHKEEKPLSSDFKSEAHRILFGDREKRITEISSLAPAKKTTGGNYNAYENGFGEVLSSAPTIKNESNQSQLTELPKKPPKKLHIQDIPELKEIPMPPPKDITHEYVGGTILNGDEISDQLAEKMVKKEEPQMVSVPPQPIEEPSEQPRAPIMNGDFFAKQMQSKAAEEAERAAQEARKAIELKEQSFAAPESDSIEYPRAPIIRASDFTVLQGADSSQEVPLNHEINKPSVTKRAPILDIAAEDSAEKRFEKMFTDERKIKTSKDVSVHSIIDNEDEPFNDKDFENDFEERIMNFEKQSLEEQSLTLQKEQDMEKSSKSFHFVEEVEDLSEKDHFEGKDNTGYYTTVHDLPPTNVKLKFGNERISDTPSPTLRSSNQIKLDDYIAGAPVDVKPKKKKVVKYLHPPIDMLVTIENDISDSFTTECEDKARLLEETLKGLKLPAKVNEITRGPAVTRYELDMPPGIPVKRIEQYSTDIEYYLASNGKIRIETPIPGKRAVGIEVPNEKIDIVGLKEIISSKEFQNSSSPLTVALGKDIAGANIICCLDKMPHLLIAGATGSGKSACLNSIIISLLYKSSPSDVRLILIDPKHVEFTVYKGLPHLLTEEIITDTQQAINTLKWARNEMNRRYLLFGKYTVRNLQEFNKCDAVKDGAEEKLPYIVLIVDELAELMMANNRKELEDKIMSMAQKARAAGIHLILATQRPSVDVITGTIKANLPSRIAFSVKSMVDSRTILDQMGAETLLGRGDMLYAPLGVDDPKRVQGAYVTNEEVTLIANFVKENNEADFDSEVKDAIALKEERENEDEVEEEKEFDDIMPEVLKCVIESGSASTSMIQRRFSVGYARASRIIDQMELHKFIGPLDGSKPRAVYISREQYKELFGKEI